MSTLCKAHNNNIKVFARFRPTSKTEKEEEISQGLNDNGPKFRSSQEVILKRPTKSSSKTRQQFKAVLDHMFPMTTTQKEVFEVLGRPMVEAVLQGYNSTIFAYGQTGSGKTYTMFGPNKRGNESHLGLVQRSCNYLFDKLTKSTQGEVVEFQVEAAFIQIYKSHISDLLAPNSKDLAIKTDFQTNTPYIKNLKIVSVNSVEDILINLQIAFGNRKVASHKLNSTSSRSHMLLMLTVVQKTRDGAIKKSKLNFGDLAGSEDIRKAHGKNSSQILKDEAIEINKSLSALTKAINFLSKGQRPSYRESPLTHILQDSLGGNSKTTMLVAASPHIMNREETIRTLRFAMTAQTVKNKAKVNKVMSRSQLLRRIEELEAMNAKLKARVIELETGLRSQGIEIVGSLEITGSLPRGADIIGDDEKDEILLQTKPKATGTELSYSTTSIQQIDVLRQEIDAANERARKQQERNVELERRNMDLLTDIDTMEKQMKLKQKEIDGMKGSIGNFMKEREIMEQRNEELQKELSLMQSKANKAKENMDKQIQRQRNNITMHQTEKKELQRIVQELNLQNESLLQQNDLFMKQMNSLKRNAEDKDDKSSDNEPDVNGNEVDDEEEDFMGEDEKNMDPAELLLHRFADAEANDFRLTKKQKMYKTAKMMDELSDDIDGLMKQWLPDKFRKNVTKNKYLVYRVRQLIGHFNVLVKQMKSNEESFQNDLKLDIKRRDQEIKTLKQEIQVVHQLKDDLLEKDDTIEQLKKLIMDLRVENEHLKSQTVTQQDTIFDIQAQCRYLRDELSKGNSSIKELKEKLEKAKVGKILSIDSDIADLDRDDMSDTSDVSDVSSGSGEEESKSSEPLRRKQSKKKPKMSMWRESIKAGDRLDCKRESGAWCTAQIVGYRSNADILQVRYDGWGDEHDEIVSRTSNRLAVHNSMTKYTNNGNNNGSRNDKGGLVRDGFMFKEGKMFKTWRKRYFTLKSNGVMSYYHDRGDENAIGSFNVNDMKKTTRASFGKSREYGLELYTDTRVWKFLCKNDKDLAEWIQAINSCSKN